MVNTPLDQKEYNLASMTISDLVASVRLDFPGYPIHVRDHVGFQPAYVDWIRRGTKKCTIRYRQDEIDLPSTKSMPMRETRTDRPGWHNNIGELTVERLVIKRFGLLDDNDTIWDGFKSIEELKAALQRVYGSIGSNQLVSIYWFGIKAWSSLADRERR